MKVSKLVHFLSMKVSKLVQLSDCSQIKASTEQCSCPV